MYYSGITEEKIKWVSDRMYECKYFYNLNLKVTCEEVAKGNIVLNYRDQCYRYSDNIRVLLVNQFNSMENGIYVCTDGRLIRATDFMGRQPQDTVVFITTLAEGYLLLKSVVVNKGDVKFERGWYM
jgi:hypothetical protein